MQIMFQNIHISLAGNRLLNATERRNILRSYYKSVMGDVWPLSSPGQSAEGYYIVVNCIIYAVVLNSLFLFTLIYQPSSHIHKPWTRCNIPQHIQLPQGPLCISSLVQFSKNNMAVRHWRFRQVYAADLIVFHLTCLYTDIAVSFLSKLFYISSN